MNKAAQKLGRMGKNKRKTLTQEQRDVLKDRMRFAQRHRWKKSGKQPLQMVGLL